MEEIKGQLKKKLQELNQNVHSAIEERTKFLDDYMFLFCKFQIGDIIKNKKSKYGRYGIVSGHYRYHQDQNKLYDTSFDVDCYYKTSDISYSNTSSEWGTMSFEKVDVYEGERKGYLSWLKEEEIAQMEKNKKLYEEMFNKMRVKE